MAERGPAARSVRTAGDPVPAAPGDEPTVARRRIWPAVLCVLLVLLAVAWVSGRQSLLGAPDRPASLDAVRLGPDPGAPVADYLAGLPARWPAPGAPAVPALVQFGTEQDPGAVARLVAPAGPVTVVFRVPLPRVQTALRFEPLPAVDLADPVAGTARRLALARQSAARDASTEVVRLTGRPASVARYEAAVLGSPTPCRCVLAVLVVGDRARLSALAGQSEVRAVDAAPEGTPPTGVALAPLLPEQTTLAAAMPDDGPVPNPPTGP
ncbi:MAG TPA: hypothetical protein VH141_19830 [Pseudonocardia sp.]|jgi:hypothetical protein|nr:hypothetical protein [Pseudonocardia sp.]